MKIRSSYYRSARMEVMGKKKIRIRDLIFRGLSPHVSPDMTWFELVGAFVSDKTGGFAWYAVMYRGADIVCRIKLAWKSDGICFRL